MKHREIRIANLHLLDEGVLYIVYKDSIQVTKKDAEEMIDALSSLESSVCPRIYRYNKNISFDLDAIRTLATSHTANAIAILCDSSQGMKILDDIKQYFRTFNFNSPIQYFYEKSHAINWAIQYTNTHGNWRPNKTLH